MLARANPAQSERLLALAQRDIDERWRFYEQMAGVERSVPDRMELEEVKSMGVDLRTRYLGLELKNPLVVSACPLSGKVETLRRLEEAGAAAVGPALAVRGADRPRPDGGLRVLRGPGQQLRRGPAPTSRRWWPTTPARTPTCG